MSNPTIFISCVTKELGSARQQVANSLSSMGYDPIWQDVFETAPGELLDVIRKKIHACDGLVQIVGQTYGSEPPQETEQFGRVSYTQYELLYADSLGMKVWILPIAGVMQNDDGVDELQLEYLRKLEKKNYLRHEVKDEKELEIAILKMRDDFSELRKKAEKSQANMFSQLKLILLVLLGVGGLVFITKNALKEDAEANRSAIEKVGETLAKSVDNQILERQLLSRVLEYTSRSLEEEKGLSFENSYEQALVSVAKEEEIPVVELSSKIDNYVSTVKSEGVSADPIDRVLVAEKEQRVGQAREVAENTLNQLDALLPTITDKQEKFRINTERILLLAAIFRATQEERRQGAAKIEKQEREKLQVEAKLAEENKKKEEAAALAEIEEKKAQAKREAEKPKPKNNKEWILDANEHERVISAKINLVFRTRYVPQFGKHAMDKENNEMIKQRADANSVDWSDEQLNIINAFIDPIGKKLLVMLNGIKAGKYSAKSIQEIKNEADANKRQEKELIKNKILLGTLKRKT